MASFCRRHSYRGGKSPAVLLARLRSAPSAPVGIPPATLATLVRTQVQLLRTLLATIADLEAAIAKRVACHPRAQLLASLPGVGTINLAQLLAEVGPILDRVPSAEHAAAECGAAPVTKASGKTSGVYFRWAANRRARKALTAFAHNSRLASPWAGRLYADARARGKRNPHATRIVARAWLRVIWACWRQGAPYNPPCTPPLFELQLSQLDSGDSNATSPARSTPTSPCHLPLLPLARNRRHRRTSPARTRRSGTPGMLRRVPFRRIVKLARILAARRPCGRAVVHRRVGPASRPAIPPMSTRITLDLATG
jgi:hypothetical protein